jgi:hypothetical protein
MDDSQKMHENVEKYCIKCHNRGKVFSKLETMRTIKTLKISEDNKHSKNCIINGDGNNEHLTNEEMKDEKLTKDYKCIGKTKNGKQCRYEVVENEKVCNIHMDMKDYTKYMIQNIRKCPECPKQRARWRYFNDDDRMCSVCIDKYIKRTVHIGTSELITEIGPIHYESGYMIAKCKHCAEIKNIWDYRIKRKIFSVVCRDCRISTLETDTDDNKNIHNTWTDDDRIEMYINKALHMNKAWKLTMEQAIEIFTRPCKYCGNEMKEMNDNGIEFSHNGLTRIDNDGGYTMENVVTLCNMCNFMRSGFTEIDFLYYCENIRIYIGSKTPKNMHHAQYIDYKTEAKAMKILFEMTEKEFDSVLKNDCYYCDGKNESDKIMIDRMGPGGFCMKTNQMMAICKICYSMKSSLCNNDFFNHILKILHFNGMITTKTYDERYMISERCDPGQIIKDLRKSIECYDNEINYDRRNPKKIFENNNDVNYIKQIWTGLDISSIYPEVVFCETKELIDMWTFYRDITSSFDRTNICGLKILVRDSFTKTYLGITELSLPTFSVMKCETFKKYMNASNDIMTKNINNLMNIITCMPLQPFGYNFCGGKLLVKLMFSKEVYDYVYKKYKRHIYGYFSLSLYGKSTQYNGICELNYIGETSGYGVYKINSKLREKIRICLNKLNKRTYVSDLYNVRNFCKFMNIPDATFHGEKKGIYIGFTNVDGQQYFQCEQPEKEYVPNLKTAEELCKEWYTDHAMQRLKNLCERNAIKQKSDINYDEYFVSTSGYHRNRMKKHNTALKKSEVYTKHSRDTINKIINLWFNNRELPITRLSQMISNDSLYVDGRFINSIITGNHEMQYMEKKKSKQHRIMMEKLYTMNSDTKHAFIGTDKCDETFDSMFDKYQKIDENDKIFSIMMKKTKLHIYTRYCPDDSIPIDNICYKNSEIVINNLIKGQWVIKKRESVNDKIVFEMYITNYDFKNN